MRSSRPWAPMPMATRLPRPLRAMRKHVLPPSQQKPPPTTQQTRAMATRTQAMVTRPRGRRRSLTPRRSGPLHRGGPPRLVPPARPERHLLPAPRLPPCCLLAGEEAEAEAEVEAEQEAGDAAAAGEISSRLYGCMFETVYGSVESETHHDRDFVFEGKMAF